MFHLCYIALKIQYKKKLFHYIIKRKEELHLHYILATCSRTYLLSYLFRLPSLI